MHVESLQRWHWILLGLVTGAAVGIARTQVVFDRPIGGIDFISQAQLERELRLPPVMGKPYLIDIVIHPRSGLDLIRLQELDTETLQYRARWFAAQRPYRALGNQLGPSQQYSIHDYFASLAAQGLPVRARVAWWDTSTATVVDWSLIGIVVIGVIWPSLLGFMVGAGLGRKCEPQYDLDRFPGSPDAKADTVTRDETRLAELEAALLANVSDVQEDQDRNRCISPASIRELSSEQLEVVEAMAPVEREFSGEYYPVEKRARHGFTLVELTVAIGIITVLVSLLMPTLAAARRRAETLKCANNLRQIGLALQMYASSNRGWLPAWSGWHTWPPGASDDSSGPAWTIELMPFIGDPNAPIYNCPSFPGNQRCRNYFLAAKWAGKNGQNAMKFTDVTMTGCYVLSGDKTQRALYPPPFGTSDHLLDDADPDDNGDGMPILAWPWDPGGSFMHRGGNNILFDDLHVALFAGYDRSSMTFNPREMQDWADVTAG